MLLFATNAWLHQAVEVNRLSRGASQNMILEREFSNGAKHSNTYRGQCPRIPNLPKSGPETVLLCSPPLELLVLSRVVLGVALQLIFLILPGFTVSNDGSMTECRWELTCLLR